MTEEIRNDYVKELIELNKQIEDEWSNWYKAFDIANADKLQRKRILIGMISGGKYRS